MRTEFLRIEGGRPLSGHVVVDGAKNAALPACVACLLTDDPVILRRVPELRDVSTILFTLSDLGKRVVRRETSVVLGSDRPLSPEANAFSVRQMRASFLVLGPLLARLGRAVVPLPGGCAIGARSVDLHLHGLRSMGAAVEVRGGVVHVEAPRLRGARIELTVPSVGATEQLLMAATLAQGETEIRNASIEPEVLDLVALLVAMGATIDRADTTYRVEGGDALHGADHAIPPDRMEAGTYLLAGPMTAGRVSVDPVVGPALAPFLEALERAGLDIARDGRGLYLRGEATTSVSVRTAPHPGFPTDLHPPLAAMLCLGPQTSRITETIFEHRHTYVDGLRAMGAAIDVAGRTVTFRGGGVHGGAQLVAPDIRSGAAFVLAGLAAHGTTQVAGLDKIDRGYAHLVPKLRGLGGCIERRTSAA